MVCLGALLVRPLFSSVFLRLTVHIRIPALPQSINGRIAQSHHHHHHPLSFQDRLQTAVTAFCISNTVKFEHSWWYKPSLCVSKLHKAPLLPISSPRPKTSYETLWCVHSAPSHSFELWLQDPRAYDTSVAYLCVSSYLLAMLICDSFLGTGSVKPTLNAFYANSMT